MDETTDVLSTGGGALVIVFVIGALRMAFNLPSRWLPLMAIVGGVGWGTLAAVLGTFEGNLILGALSGIVTAASASGLQGWTQTYRSAP